MGGIRFQCEQVTAMNLPTCTQKNNNTHTVHCRRKVNMETTEDNVYGLLLVTYDTLLHGCYLWSRNKHRLVSALRTVPPLWVSVFHVSVQRVTPASPQLRGIWIYSDMKVTWISDMTAHTEITLQKVKLHSRKKTDLSHIWVKKSAVHSLKVGVVSAFYLSLVSLTSTRYMCGGNVPWLWPPT